MAKSKSTEARQLEQLLQEKLIPLAQNGAPVILFDAPPRSSTPLDIRKEVAEPLVVPKQKKQYPEYYIWLYERDGAGA